MQHQLPYEHVEIRGCVLSFIMCSAKNVSADDRFQVAFSAKLQSYGVKEKHKYRPVSLATCRCIAYLYIRYHTATSVTRFGDRTGRNLKLHLLEYVCTLINNVHVYTFSLALQVARHELLNVESALWPITDRKWVACAATKLPSRPKSLKLINQQLWCCCGWSGIVVFDIKRHHQFNIARGEMGKVYDVAQMSNGNVLIATPSGLYHTDATGI